MFGFTIRTYKELAKNEADQFPIFRYPIERISAWSSFCKLVCFLNVGFYFILYVSVKTANCNLLYTKIYLIFMMEIALLLKGRLVKLYYFGEMGFYLTLFFD